MSDRDRKRVAGRRAGGRVWALGRPLVVLGLSTLLAFCTPLRIDLPINETESDWPVDGRNGSRLRTSLDEPVRLPIEQAWIYNAAAGFGAGSPLIVSDYVFIPTRKGEIHVVDLPTGDKVGTEAFGLSVEGTPGWTDNTLYIPNSWGKHALTAFDLVEGKKTWQYRGVPIEASVLIWGDRVIVGDVEANIVALDRSTGLVDWVYEFEKIASIFAGPVLVGEDRAVVATEAGEIACVNLADGSEVWRKEIDAAVEASLSADARRVYIPTTRGELLAVNWQTGETEWIYTASGELVRLGGAAISGQSIVFGGSDGILRAVNAASGSTIWTFKTDGTFAAAPAISGQLVFVGAMDRMFFAINLLDGSMQWSTKLRGRVKSAPAIRKGLVVVLSEPKYVYAFGNVEEIPTL